MVVDWAPATFPHPEGVIPLQSGEIKEAKLKLVRGRFFNLLK